MITLTSINETQYKVIIDTSDIEPEEARKLIRKRDRFPAEFVKDLEDLLPAGQQLDNYDHYSLVLTVNG